MTMILNFYFLKNYTIACLPIPVFPISLPLSQSLALYISVKRFPIFVIVVKPLEHLESIQSYCTRIHTFTIASRCRR